MSFRPDICPRTEYDDNFDLRLKEDELTLGALCTTIFTLRGSNLAMRFPSRIVNVGEPLNGLIEFVPLDADLKPATLSLVVKVSDGIISMRHRLHPIGPLEAGLFTGYEDSFDFDLSLSGTREATLVN